mgnify:CR=1 FL=1
MMNEAVMLGDHIELAYGKSLPAAKRRTGAVPVFGSNGQVGTHDESAVDGPGIIVGRKGSVGEVAFSSESFWPIDTTYYVINKQGHNWRFLYYLLRHSGLTGLNSHSAVPGLNREDVYSLTGWIPDERTQGRVAEALYFIERAALAEAEAESTTQQLKRSIAADLFTRGLRADALEETEIGPAPATWEVRRLGDDHHIAGGGTPRRSIPEFWDGGTIPWVKTAEVNYSVIQSTAEHITQAGLDNSSAKLLPPGTLLIAMFGQGVTRGRVAILGIEATCNQACAAVQPLNNRINTRFLYHLLTNKYNDLRQLAHGGQQQNLNIDIIRGFRVAVPPTCDEQQEIADILDALDRKINLHRDKKLVLEDIFKALLHGLMSSELSVEDLDLSALPSAEEALV